MRTTATRCTALLFAVGLTAAACGGSDESADTSPADTDPPATEAPADTEPPATEAPADTEPPATEAPVETEPPATDPPLEELEFGDGIGPYTVGVQTIVVPDATGADRNLTVDIWFPLADDTTGDPQQYTLIPGVYYESPRALAASPESISPDGPFPLVVYSHGSGGLRYIHSDYTEAIASHGYIVVAPDHTGNTAADDLLGTRADQAVTALNRPRDVSAVIDAMLNPESAETAGFVANVDPERIAVTGHSFGGFTSYAVASGYTNDLGEYVADERVGALITLAPATGSALLTDELLASIDIPTLVMAGTDDQTTPIEPNVTRPWELLASTEHYRVDLVAAEHQTFTDVCDYLVFLPTLPDPVPEPVLASIETNAQQGCLEGDMPIDRAQAITNTFAVAFLESVFRDGEPIAPEQVDEQDDLVYLVK